MVFIIKIDKEDLQTIKNTSFRLEYTSDEDIIKKVLDSSIIGYSSLEVFKIVE